MADDDGLALMGDPDDGEPVPPPAPPDTYAEDEGRFNRPPVVLPPRRGDAGVEMTPPEILARLWGRWFPGRSPSQPVWHGLDGVAEVFRSLEFDPTKPVDIKEINELYRLSCSELGECLRALERSGEIRQNGADAMIRMICRKLEAVRLMLVGMNSLYSADMLQPSDLPRDDYGLWRFITPEASADQDPSPNQLLIMFTLNDAMRQGYRRYRNGFYVVQKTADGRPTCAWTEQYSFGEYCRSLTARRLGNPQVWGYMTAGGGWAAAKRLQEYLENSADPEVPWLNPDRHVFSFNNGVYLAKEEVFMDYQELAERYHQESYPVASNHFSMDFDPRWSDPEAYPDPMAIPTPALDSIFDTQHLGADVRRWSCTFFGRLLYDVREMDDWQIFPFIKGLAGTGKSVLLNHLKKIYNAQDVGIISNVIEKQFGFSQIARKFLGVADDIRSTFQMDQSDFQNACSGNAVSCAVKHGKPDIVDPWTTPIVGSGNEPPGYHDNSGSYGRRMAVIAFLYLVGNPDGAMAQRLMDEMPAFIVKCNRQYRNMLRRHGTRGIWQILPQEFRMQRNELTATSNAMIGFITSGMLIKGPELYLPLNKLRDAVVDYARRNNLEKPRWGPDYYRGPLIQEGLRVTDETLKKIYPPRSGKRVTGKFVFGCDMRDEDDGSSAPPQLQMQMHQGVADALFHNQGDSRKRPHDAIQ